MIHPIIVPTKYSLRSFNFYLVQEENELTLIDAGINIDECWEYFNRTLNENGLSVHDITRIILTHNHEDHTGLVNRITSIKNVPIYAHEESIIRLKRDKDYFSLRIDFFDQLYREMGCGEEGREHVGKLRKAMNSKERFKIQGDIHPIVEGDIVSGLQVIETPGHSPDHVVLLQPETQNLFGGDHLVGHISSNAIVEPDRQGNRILTINEYLQSLQKCLELDINTVYSGHGRIIKNPKELIHHRIERIHQKSEQILSLIKEGMTTASEIARSFYKDKYRTEFSLVMSEIIGHIDYLELCNKIKKEKKEGVWHYSEL
ncbi:MBL fold metallo-hydrolase [Bacillus massiliigorillae]|uniref:MBL fold metallo-hydrolase n=1 Tax=Bacillus massiliigorillae TaxID=1243664 RepID=UPI0003A3F5BC|nr:MBL fold metallo-hydrolase [Bacillus massiliigorillae]